MRTPWKLARAAAAALAGNSPAQSFALERYGRPLVVSLGSEGTAQALPPPPRAVLTIEDSTQGGTAAPTLRLGLGIITPSDVDPATGEKRDPSKPVRSPAGFLETGDGECLLALAWHCVDTIAEALEPRGAFLQAWTATPTVGIPTGDFATVSLSFTLALGRFDPAGDPDEPDEITTPASPEQPKNNE